MGGSDSMGVMQGQCLSNPDTAEGTPRQQDPSTYRRGRKSTGRTPSRKLGGLRESLRARYKHGRYTDKHQPSVSHDRIWKEFWKCGLQPTTTTHHPEEETGQEVRRQQIPIPREDQPSTSAPLNVHMPVDDEPVSSAHREGGSSAITPPQRDVPSYLTEAPQPQRPQDVQEYVHEYVHDQEQSSITKNLESTPEPTAAPSTEAVADDFPADFPKELFNSRLRQILEAQMDEKEHELVDIKAEPIKKDYIKGVLDEMKKVKPDVLDEAAPSDLSMKAGEESPQVSASIQTSTGAQSSTETQIFSVQEIKGEDFRKGRRLGSGRSGIVHLAIWHGAEVAVKEFYGSDQRANEKSMQQEVKTLSMLKHPGVVTLFGVCPTNKPPCILMEYVVDGSLKSQLMKLKEKSHGVPFSLRTKIKIALQAAYAMEYLHSRNIIHFDIKAENFLCDLRDLTRPIVKVADVGLSKHKIASFVSGSMRGTLPWMAPELFPTLHRDSVNTAYTPERVDKKVDVYSFGIVLWEIWNMGADPYPTMSAADVLYRILDGALRPEIPEDCPQEWKQLMTSCWTQNPVPRPNFDSIAYKLECILKTL